jgi:hypothetical protein
MNRVIDIRKVRHYVAPSRQIKHHNCKGNKRPVPASNVVSAISTYSVATSRKTDKAPKLRPKTLPFSCLHRAPFHTLPYLPATSTFMVDVAECSGEIE